MPRKEFTPLLSKAGSKMYRNSHIIAEITKNYNTGQQLDIDKTNISCEFGEISIM